MKRVSLFYAFFLISLFSVPESRAQLFPPKNYPQNFFQWPVGATIALAANFGELRPNHYHMGLDCKTNQRENLPVCAAAAGYISKVKIEPYGFGRAIYINHPNGYTTLYAHLNNFTQALEEYIKQQQYLLQQWKMTIDIPPGMFPLSKGEFIAYSGNSGGSQGPHVHFEIRDTKTDKVLNPLLFGMPVTDKIPPDILRLAIYDRRISTYDQVPKIYLLKKINGVYSPVNGNISIRTDKVSFAITAYDRYSGSTNQNGIYKAEIFNNGEAIGGFEMDSIRYDETRYMNAHVDYRTKSTGGPWLEHLSKLPGHENSIYNLSGENDGTIQLSDENQRDIKIVISDANNNSSTLQFGIKRQFPFTTLPSSGNNINKMFYPAMINVFENNEISFYLPEKSLYDSFRFIYKEIKSPKGKTIYQLHNTTVPVHNYFPIKIKDDFASADTSRIVMKRSAGAKEDYKKATFENGWYKASFREFGNFELLIDSVPPTVTAIGLRNGMNVSKVKRISFLVSDNTEEIIRFNALLDGSWLRFTNDKGKVFSYEFDEHCGPGEHELTIIATDQVGNSTEKIYRFTR